MKSSKHLLAAVLAGAWLLMAPAAQALDAGVAAPTFSLPTPSGKPFNLADAKGKVNRKSTRLNSSHIPLSRMPSSA